MPEFQPSPHCSLAELTRNKRLCAEKESERQITLKPTRSPLPDTRPITTHMLRTGASASAYTYVHPNAGTRMVLHGLLNFVEECLHTYPSHVGMIHGVIA